MKQIEFRRWEVRSAAQSGAPLIGELFFPINAEGNEMDDASNDSANDYLSEKKNKKTVGSRITRMNSTSSFRQPLLPRFRYSTEWIESGFALGADLPLESGVKMPARGKQLFGFLADRALSPQSGSIFQSARNAGSKIMDGTEAFRNAGEMEMLSLLLPHRDAHAGGAEFYTDGVQAGSASRIPNESSSLESILYALHAEERGRANLKALIDLSSATALPGRHTAQVVVSGNEEKALTLRRYSDLIDAPLWREVFMQLARDCGIACVDTRLADTMGARALFADRADRNDGLKRFTLSARTLSPERSVSYLGIADILNREGAVPRLDLPQVWRRMVFSLLTGAEDRGEKWLFYRTDLGWRLAKTHGFSPASGAARRLTVDGRRPLASLDDAVRLAPYFAMTLADAKASDQEMRRVLSFWEDRALELGADASEAEMLSPGFEAY